MLTEISARFSDVVTHIDTSVAHARTHAWLPTSAKIRKSHASAREAGQNTVRHSVARERVHFAFSQCIDNKRVDKKVY